MQRKGVFNDHTGLFQGFTSRTEEGEEDVQGYTHFGEHGTAQNYDIVPFSTH